MMRPSPVPPDAQIAPLLAEWAEIAARAARVTAAWQPALERMAAEEAGLRSAGRWVHGRDDFLGVLGLERDEVRHSRMVAWLFDPCAPHGLGDRVLAGVLRAAFGDDLPESVYAALGAARPTCEVARDDCRIDVLVRSGALTLVVENKVDADEGDGQCDAYFALFQQEPGARFLFLTPTGRAPRSATGDAREAFRSISYATLRTVLRDALAAADPPGAGASVARDYLRTLQREFP